MTWILFLNFRPVLLEPGSSDVVNYMDQSDVFLFIAAKL
jgi:hypothetical protein